MRPPRFLLALGVLLLLAPGGRGSRGQPQQANTSAAVVTFQTLLDEMVDRTALARWPAPSYSGRQFSSYDRRVHEDRKHWHANNDKGHFLRVEQREGRRESVLMEVAGPGAVVRIWSANPKGVLRVYLDNATQPVIEKPMKELLEGNALVASPLAAEKAAGYNLYLPIPYAAHCKITCDAGRDLYYVINYRAYEPGTVVRPFTMDDLATAGARLNQAQQTLRNLPAGPDGVAKTQAATLAPGQTTEVVFEKGPQAIRRIAARVEAEDPEQALRSLVLQIKFDGRQTVGAPLGDFFGSGVGVNPFQDWWRTVEKDGHMTCRWIMPFRERCVITVKNFGPRPARVHLEAAAGDWQWDERSLYFHANWRQEGGIHTRPPLDWNFITLQGQGVFVGDTLALVNPVHSWWGEGDEKIYVDGEEFPSHVGTGTEDYYGYAWMNNMVFDAPFHAQPRSDGSQVGQNASFPRSNRGHTTNTRTRSLDAIPFSKSLRFDMEIWHWASLNNLVYAATTYWYARPGATANLAANPGPAMLNVSPVPPLFQIAGALECESMEVVAKAKSAQVRVQPRWESPPWSEDLQLSVVGKNIGDFVELRFPAPGNAPHRLALHATKNAAYGVVRCSVDGKPAGGKIDLFHGKAPGREVTGPIDLGVFAPVDGHYTLRVEVVEPEEKRPLRPNFGLDAITLTPVR